MISEFSETQFPIVDIPRTCSKFRHEESRNPEAETCIHLHEFPFESHLLTFFKDGKCVVATCNKVLWFMFISKLIDGRKNEFLFITNSRSF